MYVTMGKFAFEEADLGEGRGVAPPILFWSLSIGPTPDLHASLLITLLHAPFHSSTVS